MSEPAGATLRKARFAKGLSVKQTAHKVGVSPASIVHWEYSRKVPTPEHRQRLADVLGVDVYAASQSEVA